MKDYYNILGLKENATKDQIRKAHRKLSHKFHPDKNDGDAFFADMFKNIQEAYETLKDHQKRRAYDRKRNDTKNNTNTGTGNNNSNTNFLPDIEYFSADKTTFEYGKDITFSWKCINADSVELKPFGKVKAIGSKTVRIRDFENKHIEVRLIATNSYIQKKMHSTIQLQNLTYQNLKDKIIKEYLEQQQEAKEKAQRNKSNQNHQRSILEDDGISPELDNRSLGVLVLVMIIFLISILVILSK